MSLDVPRTLRGYLTCLRFEWTKMRRLRLPKIALLLPLLSIVASGIYLSRTATPPEGWLLLTDLLSTAFSIATFFLVIQGSLAVNDEVSTGALRSVLVRPVSRLEIIGAKITVLAAFAVAVAAAIVAAASLWMATHGGVGAVGGDFGGFDVEVFTRDVMFGHVRRILFAVVPAIVCMPILGILISVILDSTGAAVATAVFLLAASKPLGGASESLADWLPSTAIDRPLAWMSELARGIEEHARRVEELDLGSPDVWRPIVGLAISAIATVVVFSKREIRC